MTSITIVDIDFTELYGDVNSGSMSFPFPISITFIDRLEKGYFPFENSNKIFKFKI